MVSSQQKKLAHHSLLTTHRSQFIAHLLIICQLWLFKEDSYGVFSCFLYCL